MDRFSHSGGTVPNPRRAREGALAVRTAAAKQKCRTASMLSSSACYLRDRQRFYHAPTWPPLAEILAGDAGDVRHRLYPYLTGNPERPRSWKDVQGRDLQERSQIGKRLPRCS